MSEVLKGKVAVVVGSGQGIGRAIAVGMAQEGARVLRPSTSTTHIRQAPKPGSLGS